MRKKVARYLSGEKFNWLISDNGLYLSAAADQSDAAEGVYDHTFLSRHIAENIDNSDLVSPANLDKHMLGLQEVGREFNYLSCWYLGVEESQEMWDEFGANGVMIFSDDWVLSDALPPPLEQAISFSEVIYSDELKPHAVNDPLQVKNEKFRKEKEFRIIFDLMKYSILTGFEAHVEARVGGQIFHESEGIASLISKQGMEQSHKVIRRKGRGLVIEYPLNSIIEEVRVHPQATNADLLKIKSCLQAAGINCPVSHSSLRRGE